MRTRSIDLIVVAVVGIVTLDVVTGGGRPTVADSGPPPTISVAASSAPADGQASEGDTTNAVPVPAACGPWTVNIAEVSADSEDAQRYLGVPIFQQALAESPLDPPSATYYSRWCENPPRAEARWFPDGVGPPPPTVDDLWPGAYDEAVRRIPLPSLDMSPPPEAGGIVNIGLWLAVEEPQPVTARAEAGSVWAQATATLIGLAWDMGAGDMVECSGFGDPIIDPNVREQSPYCGYTYEWPSVPQFTGAGNAYEASVTAHWGIQITGSDGRNVAATPVDVTFEFLYPVCEVQTLGVDPDAGPIQEAGMSCAEAAGVGS
jgi:hypothetical protein